jgi:hypothetical protein
MTATHHTPAHAADPATPALGDYLRIESLCESMLVAARSDDWDKVGELQSASQALISGLRSAAEHPLAGAARREQLRIMRRILILDGELRRLAEPWQQGLDRMFAPPRDRRADAHRAAWN